MQGMHPLSPHETRALDSQQYSWRLSYKMTATLCSNFSLNHILLYANLIVHKENQHPEAKLYNGAVLRQWLRSKGGNHAAEENLFKGNSSSFKSSFSQHIFAPNQPAIPTPTARPNCQHCHLWQPSALQLPETWHDGPCGTDRMPWIPATGIRCTRCILASRGSWQEAPSWATTVTAPSSCSTPVNCLVLVGSQRYLYQGKDVSISINAFESSLFPLSTPEEFEAKEDTVSVVALCTQWKLQWWSMVGSTRTSRTSTGGLKSRSQYSCVWTVKFPLLLLQERLTVPGVQLSLLLTTPDRLQQSHLPLKGQGLHFYACQEQYERKECYSGSITLLPFLWLACLSVELEMNKAVKVATRTCSKYNGTTNSHMSSHQLYLLPPAAQRLH